MDNKKDQTNLRKGNINFDLLKPEGIVRIKKTVIDNTDKNLYSKQTKRGQFDTGRKLNPVGALQIFIWAIVFIASLGTFTLILWQGSSLLWMIILPFIIVLMLWSMIMLALFKARPR